MTTPLFVQKTKCDRCPTVTEKEVTADQLVQLMKGTQKELKPSLTIQLSGEQFLSYTHLCGACNEIVSQHLRAIGPVEKKASLKPRGKKEAQ